MADTGRSGRLGRGRQALAGKTPQPLKSFFTKHVRPHLPDASFITLHYLYFCSTCLVASIIFWGSSTPSRSVSYTDSLFLSVSAMTEAGLNTVNLSELNVWQQVMLFLLIMLGSAIFVSSAILHIRKRAFERKLEDLAERKKKTIHISRSFTFSRSRSRSRSISGRQGNPKFEMVEAITPGAVRGRPISNDTDDHDESGGSSENQANAVQKSEQESALRPEPIDTSLTSPEDPASPARIRFQDPAPIHRDSSSPPRLRRTHTRVFTGSGVGVRSMGNHPRNAHPIPHAFEQQGSNSDDDEKKRTGSLAKLGIYLNSMNGYIGRNSQFHNLTEKERRKLGGIEYDAVALLSYIVPIYFVLWQLLGAIGMGAYFQSKRPSLAYENGLNPFWTGAFFAVSAFNNSGMALLDANAAALQTSYYALLTLSILILAGNTCFPPFLRLIIWSMKKLIPKESPEWHHRRQIICFILDHPRRVYTNLFPSQQTWWLVLTLFCLNGIDWIAYEILNIGNPNTDTLAPRYRVLDGIFQAFAVRSGGFYVTNISGLRSGLLVLYVLMMYVSALPVSMTIRNTNVYEERSLGIFSEDLPTSTNDQSKAGEANGTRSPGIGVFDTIKRTFTSQPGGGMNNTGPGPVGHRSWSRQDFLRQQLRGQLGHDLWWLALAVLFITIIETGQFERDPVVFATFNIIFEVFSAYGCVGISTGVPWAAYSFCGTWHTGSKLVLCAVMLRGRHRGLPVAIDKAVLLPDETLAWAEEEDGLRRMNRENPMGRATAVGDGSGASMRRRSYSIDNYLANMDGEEDAADTMAREKNDPALIV